MSSFASPVQIVAMSAAVAWPLAAGVTVVAWSKVRAAHRRRLLAQIDGGLKGLFGAIEGEPVPERLDLVVETLEEPVVAPSTPRAPEPLTPAS